MMNKNALFFDTLTVDEMFFMLVELNKKFGSYSVVANHHADWSEDLDDNLDYCSGFAENYDPLGFARKNWPQSSIYVKLDNPFGFKKEYFDVVVDFNHVFLWSLAFNYYHNNQFCVFSKISSDDKIKNKILNLCIETLSNLSGDLTSPYSTIEYFDVMDEVGRELDFMLITDIGDDGYSHPLFFCKHVDFIEFIKNHEIFNGQCEYYDREKILQDSKISNWIYHEKHGTFPE